MIFWMGLSFALQTQKAICQTSLWTNSTHYKSTVSIGNLFTNLKSTIEYFRTRILGNLQLKIPRTNWLFKRVSKSEVQYGWDFVRPNKHTSKTVELIRCTLKSLVKVKMNKMNRTSEKKLTSLTRSFKSGTTLTSMILFCFRLRTLTSIQKLTD